MKRTRWLAALLLIVSGGGGLRAQFIGHPHHHHHHRRGFNLGFSTVRKNFALSLSLSRGHRGYCYNPYLSPYRGVSLTRVYLYRPPAPPPVVVQPVLPVLPPELLAELRNPAPRPAPPPERPLPGDEAGRFRPLDPLNRARARRPVPPEPPAPPEDRGKEPEPPRRLPRPPLPDPDPKLESARQVELGKEAFANREYGRAANRFRLAVVAAPAEPLPYFLLAQARAALGNYRRAYDALLAGLRLNPDWPAAPFRPIELYGENVADYADHLRRVGDALDVNPDDAVPLFLRAYQLWFDGRRAEARPLLERVAPALPAPAIAERFLRELPGLAL